MAKMKVQNDELKEVWNSLCDLGYRVEGDRGEEVRWEFLNKESREQFKKAVISYIDIEKDGSLTEKVLKIKNQNFWNKIFGKIEE